MELVGFVAGSLVALSLFPQVLKSWQTKSTKDIAISWTLINLSGQILWIVYGIGIHSLPLTIMSSITFVMALSLLCLKLFYG